MYYSAAGCSSAHILSIPKEEKVKGNGRKPKSLALGPEQSLLLKKETAQELSASELILFSQSATRSNLKWFAACAFDQSLR